MCQQIPPRPRYGSKTTNYTLERLATKRHANQHRALRQCKKELIGPSSIGQEKEEIVLFWEMLTRYSWSHFGIETIGRPRGVVESWLEVCYAMSELLCVGSLSIAFGATDKFGSVSTISKIGSMKDEKPRT